MSVTDGLSDAMVEALLKCPGEWTGSNRIAPMGTIGALEGRGLIESRYSPSLTKDFDVRLTAEGRRLQEAIAATR